jgi:hypothetical protein
MSTIHFVGGEKGGVGKSVMSRVLSQYFLDHQMPYVGLDADHSQSTMTRYYKEFTKDVDLEDYESIDQVINESISKSCEVLVDLPAQSQRFLTRWMDDNSTLELCDELKVNIIFWYLVDDGPDSANLLKNFLETYERRMNIVVVKNLGRGSKFTAIDAMPLYNETMDSFFRNAKIELPALHHGTLHKIDRLQLNFWAAANVKSEVQDSLGMMERQRARVWMKKSYAAIDQAFEQLQPSLVYSAILNNQKYGISDRN